MKQTLAELRKAVKRSANPARIPLMERFFQTGKGQYGEGDRFVGMTVPQIRLIVKMFRELPFAETSKLLRSPIHEERMIALFILAHQYKKGDEAVKQKIFDLYVRSTSKYINGWDLVDTTAPHIVGAHLFPKKNVPLLTKFARSKNLWEKRVAILATQNYIRYGQFSETLRIAKILLHDDHDLIHKAVGWMLREVGNRDLATEKAFLAKHYKTMPRTALRYAIEKFPKSYRLAYLKGKISARIATNKSL